MLPSIEDAWNLPITAEMNSRQQQMQQRGGGAAAAAAGQAFPQRGPAFAGPDGGPTQTKRFKIEAGTPVVEGGQQQARPPVPNYYLTPQQMQMMQYLQQNQTSLTPQQQHLLQQLQNHYRLMQQHQQQQQQLRLQQQQQQQQQQMMRPGQPFAQRAPAPFAAMGAGGPQQGFPRAAAPQQQAQMHPPQQQQQQQQSFPAASAPMSCPPSLSSPSGVNVSDQELQALLSQKDIATSLAEDLLKQFAQEGELDLEQPQTVATPTSVNIQQPVSAPPTPTATSTPQNPPSNIRIATKPKPVLAFGGPMGRPSAPRGRVGTKGGQGISKIVEDASDTEDERLAADSGELKEANIKMTAREVLESCRGE